MSRASDLQQEYLIGWEIQIVGTVQGVGFRPAVFRLAQAAGIKGRILNNGQGVLIEAWGSEPQLTDFIQAIRSGAPALSHIERIERRLLNGCHAPQAFSIAASIANGASTNISPDASTCALCLQDVFNRSNRRYRYPYINCTHCGPRLSIIRSIPYDRANTSMSSFQMCLECRSEYENPADRRFHAQPNACPDCGPTTWLEGNDGQQILAEDLSAVDAVAAASDLVRHGEIVAIKGIGGFHLACDAMNEQTVQKLRARKKRFDKPFALMARDIDIIERYCQVTDFEVDLLQNQGAPIVILPTKNRGSIACSVAPGQNTLAFMLPYTALHHIFMRDFPDPIVLTSGNLSDEPQCIDNNQARERLRQIADYFLFNDRDIVNRLDDSIVRLMAGVPVTLRRARGYAPSPIPLPGSFAKIHALTAMGGEFKNTFCLLQDGKAILSQHIGDLSEASTYADYKRTVNLYSRCFQHKNALIAVDLHPEYHSTKLGRRMAGEADIPVDVIQHHHAHIASCLADNDWPLDGPPVIGIAFDGIGYGTDNTFWGGEFFIADYRECERLGTMKPMPLIGGDQASREPWRNTYAHIVSAMGWKSYKNDYPNLDLTKFLEGKRLNTYNAMLSSSINSPLASSCGRLFDAVAAALGICRERVSYEGQAAIELEAKVNEETLASEEDFLAYHFPIAELDVERLPCIEFATMWRMLLQDMTEGTEPGIIAARFHKGLAMAVTQMVKRLYSSLGNSRESKIVALSGGVFQNKILLELAHDRLSKENITVLTHRQVPANDGGLSLGQAVISAARQLNIKGQSPCV